MASPSVGEFVAERSVGIRRAAPALPPESLFRAHHEGDRTVFRRRYRARLGELAALTGIVVFFGGGLVFVPLSLFMQLILDLPIPLLLAFAALVLVFVFRFLFCLSAPFCEGEWTFHRDQITACFSILGMGDVKRFEPHRLWTTQVVRDRSHERRGYFSGSATSQRFAVRFVDRERRSMFEINDLTAAEAQWVEWKFKEAFLNVFLLQPERGRPRRSIMTDPLWDKWQDG
jgi:hypothetical protein